MPPWAIAEGTEPRKLWGGELFHPCLYKHTFHPSANGIFRSRAIRLNIRWQHFFVSIFYRFSLCGVVFKHVTTHSLSFSMNDSNSRTFFVWPGLLCFSLSITWITHLCSLNSIQLIRIQWIVWILWAVVRRRRAHNLWCQFFSCKLTVCLLLLWTKREVYPHPQLLIFW